MTWYENGQDKRKVFHTSFCFGFEAERGIFMMSMKGLVQIFGFLILDKRTCYRYNVNIKGVAEKRLRPDMET